MLSSQGSSSGLLAGAVRLLWARLRILSSRRDTVRMLEVRFPQPMFGAKQLECSLPTEIIQGQRTHKAPPDPVDGSAHVATTGSCSTGFFFREVVSF